MGVEGFALVYGAMRRVSLLGVEQRNGAEQR